MDNKNIFWKHALNYGAILGLSLLIFSTILYLTGFMFSHKLGWITYIIEIFITIAAIKKLRIEQDNILSYGQGVKEGIMVNVFAGIIMAMFTYTLYGVIDPDLTNQLKVMQEQALMTQGFTDDQIEVQMQLFETMNTPGVLAFSAFFGQIILGAIISLIAAIFLKRKEEDNY